MLHSDDKSFYGVFSFERKSFVFVRVKFMKFKEVGVFLYFFFPPFAGQALKEKLTKSSIASFLYLLFPLMENE
jgi:hypothetical protein